MVNPIANQDLSDVRALGRLMEWYRRAREAGLTLDDFQVLIDDPARLAKVIHIWKNLPAGTTTVERAHKIMQNQMIPLHCFQFVMKDNGPIKLKPEYDLVPFGEEELLMARASGQYLVAMPQISLAKLLSRRGDLFAEQDWYANELFLNVRSRSGYHLIYPRLPDSGQKSWDQQLNVQPKGYIPTRVVELAYLVAAKLVIGGSIEALADGYVRCEDAAYDGRILLGVSNLLIWLEQADDWEALSPVGTASTFYRPLLGLG